MSTPLRERYPALDNMLGSFFPGDDSFDAEIGEMIDTLEPHQLDQFLREAEAVLAEAVPDDELDAFVSFNVNWNFGGGRQTLAELVRKVRGARI
ncbi:MAG: hypothetical protein WDZ30_10515 [Cellvibrionaceae bacterium]